MMIKNKEVKEKINLFEIDKKNEKIVNSIFYSVKTIVDNLPNSLSEIKIKKRIYIKKEPHYIIFHIVPLNNNKKTYLNIGAAYIEHKTIYLKLRFNIRKFNDKKYYNLVLADLKDTIRHELQHFIQFSSKKYSAKTLTQATPNEIAYYLLPYEVEAFIYGFIYFNKHIKKEAYLDDILMKYIKRISKTLTISEKKLLYNIYYRYIARNFKQFIY